MPTVSCPASSRRRWLGAAALALLAATRAAAAEDDAIGKVERVVAVGDVHGDYEQLVTVLRDALLVDADLAWSGGRAHLVQTGDRIDRGPDSRKVMDLLMRLEKEARKAGGAVHALIGNHEAMNVLGDFRYVTPQEFAAFATPDSKTQPGHPPGYLEYKRAFAPKGEYGSWIVRQNAILKIGDTLFLHGGLSPKYGDFSLADINDRVRQELRDNDPQAALMSRDPDGPLWFRGLAQGDPSLARSLEEVLRRNGCKRMVVGHTPTEGLVLPRYGGRLIQIDVGLAKVFGGPPAALLLENGQAFALHRGRRIALPEEGPLPLLRYVREIAAQEPDPQRYAALIRGLEREVSAAPSPR
jgi:hypothetical protein